LLWCAAVQAQESLTEAQYVDKVMSASLEAKVLEAEAQLAQAEAVGAGAWPNPRLEWQRQPNPSEAGFAGGEHVAVASIPLVLSGRLGLEADAAERAADASRARVKRARSELKRDATLAFATVLANAERRALLERSFSTLQGLTRVIEAREKAGEAAGYDRIRIVLEQAVVEDQVRAAAEDERRAQRVALNLLGPGVTALPRLSGELGNPHAPAGRAALSANSEERGDLQALTLDEESARFTERAAARAWIPELNVTAGAMFLDGAQLAAGPGYVVGLSVPLPFFDRGQGPRARAEAQRQLAAVRYQRLKQRVQSELATAIETLQSRRERLRLHQQNVLARAEELRTIATAAYRGGSADLLAVIDAERAGREAGTNAISLKLEVDMAEADLLLVAGTDDAGTSRSNP
jgi:cobalt-zinc-cadmium efflux system outer membrane protein